MITWYLVNEYFPNYRDFSGSMLLCLLDFHYKQRYSLDLAAPAIIESMGLSQDLLDRRTLVRF